MKLLIVDDELSVREYLELLFARAGHQVQSAENLDQAKRCLGGNDIDVVVSDMKLGDESGLEVLRHAKSLPAPPEVILITAYGTPDTAVEAMRSGAYDYICKPFDNEEMLLLVAKASEKHDIVQENKRLKKSLGETGQFWVAQSPPMQKVWRLVEKIANSPRGTVLISGESGTGKELVARAIHAKSARAGRPFMPLNCAALGEGVLDSELFGHTKGAFTGANAERAGILVAAGEGTVFLDEIGEISPNLQVRLLRALQERTVKPVGSSQEVPFSARVLAATNRNLEEEVRLGRFREDLLYRLNVLTVELPPLRERPGDIRLLAGHFLAKMAEDLGRPHLSFHPDTLQRLEGYAFPGNVRQLQNVIERMATLSDSEELLPESLPPQVLGDGEAQASLPVQEKEQIGEAFDLEKHLESVERRYLLSALEEARGVKTKAAEILGLSFRSFRYRVSKLGIE